LTSQVMSSRAPKHRLEFTIYPVDATGTPQLIQGQSVLDQTIVVGTEFFNNIPEAQLITSVGAEVPVGDGFYRLANVRAITIPDVDVVTPKTQEPLTVTVDGIEYYQYESPPSDSYIGNTGEICVESLSEFEAIQIVSRSGMMYQPQVGIYSGGNRVLASYRLPFDFGTNNDGDGATETMSNAYYGDLQWSNEGNTQYLKLTSSGGVYQIQLMCQLIHRDQSKIPILLYLPPKGLIQLKLRFLTTK